MNDKKTKLSGKDLINIAIFTLLFTICIVFCVLFLGMIPFTYPFSVAVAAIVGGVFYMLLRAKAPKKGAILIQGVLIAIILMVLGSIWSISIGILIGSLIAEILCASGKYRSFKANLIGYILFFICVDIGAFAPIVFFGNAYTEFSVNNGMDAAYIEKLIAFVSGPVFLLTIVITVLCALIGGLIGKKMMNKHFVKAGIV